MMTIENLRRSLGRTYNCLSDEYPELIHVVSEIHDIYSGMLRKGHLEDDDRKILLAFAIKAKAERVLEDLSHLLATIDELQGLLFEASGREGVPGFDDKALCGDEDND